MFAAVVRVLTKHPRVWIAAGTIAALVLFGIADYLTDYRISLSIFYLGPVAVVTWYFGKQPGFAVAVLSSVISLGANFSGEYPDSDLAILIWNGLVRLAFYVICIVLLDALRFHLLHEETLAKTDSLTGAMNRRALLDALRYHVGLAARDGQPLTLAYIDLDDFKRINDSYGHVEGDRALRLVGQVLNEASRRTDLVGRLGGDEFALLLPHTDQAGAERVITKTRQLLEAAFQSERTALTCSIGAVTFVSVPRDVDDAVRVADALMYEVKSRGKNAVAFLVYDSGK
jgi:diguanylate cyclase (GGDEF)-like protein